MTTEKQIQANRNNAQKGGVKTEEGKAISKLNARKHGILSEVFTEYENIELVDIYEQLREDLQPIGVLESILVEKIAVYYIKFCRIAKAENEMVKSSLNPSSERTKKEILADFQSGDYDIIPLIEVPTTKGGYSPKLGYQYISKIESYSRYETSVENRMYKAIKELERLQERRKTSK